MKHFFLSALLAVVVTTVASAQSSRPWQKQISLDLGIEFPGSDLATAANLQTGYSTNATFYYQLLTRNTFISLGVGYVSLPIGTSSTAVTVVPVLAGVRYNFTLTGIQPYIGLEGGIYLTTIGSGSQTTDPGLMPKVGLRIPLSPGLDADLAFKYHVISGDQALSLVGLHAGIAYTIE